MGNNPKLDSIFEEYISLMKVKIKPNFKAENLDEKKMYVFENESLELTRNEVIGSQHFTGFKDGKLGYAPHGGGPLGTPESEVNKKRTTLLGIVENMTEMMGEPQLKEQVKEMLSLSYEKGYELATGKSLF